MIVKRAPIVVLPMTPVLENASRVSSANLMEGRVTGQSVPRMFTNAVAAWKDMYKW